MRVIESVTVIVIVIVLLVIFTAIVIVVMVHIGALTSTTTTHPHHRGQYHGWNQSILCRWWELKPFRWKHGWTSGLDHLEPRLIRRGLTLQKFTVATCILVSMEEAQQCNAEIYKIHCWYRSSSRLSQASAQKSQKFPKLHTANPPTSSY